MAGGLKSAAARSHLRANAGVLDHQAKKNCLSFSKATIKLHCTNGISLQQLIPTKLPIKVPFKVRNVTLVTIACGGSGCAVD